MDHKSVRVFLCYTVMEELDQMGSSKCDICAYNVYDGENEYAVVKKQI